MLGVELVPSTAPRGGGKSIIKPKRVRGRRPVNDDSEQRMVAVGSPDSYLWPNDASLSSKDEEHRRNAWWAIDSVNPNAWPAAVEYLNSTTADIALVQEAKVQEGYPCDAAEQAARVKKWNVSLNPCMVTAAGGKSAGTAVATRSHIGMSQPLAVNNANHT